MPDNQFYFARNYDWMVGYALLVVNKRGVKKIPYLRGLGSYEEANPAVWTSNYGSLTFNQYGCGFPSGGRNEAGLVVESMRCPGHCTRRRTRDPVSTPYSGSNINWIIIPRWMR